jgi:hypothetical protein
LRCSRGIGHKEFLTSGWTVNHAFYKDVLEQLRKRVQRVRKDIAGDWVLHHDNVSAHTALSIREFLVKKNIPTLPHPPYSPHLAQCDHFGTVENIRKIVIEEEEHSQKMTSGTATINGKNVRTTV